MPVQTFEAITNDIGNVHLTDAVRLPAHTKVYVVVPEQATPYADIVPQADALPPATLRLPFARVMEEGLAKQLVKTIIGEAHAEL